ncbi:predicted protein [Botrytis cinerea T4]|uniref:Uncharacterized protein n=1 Tax=Botryotinia fuckeliana (strain T4) TaxID=999810 RepID=G2YUM3_BOTF4|nr:predicted protein [Botrytis cinerea T4]
MSHRSTASEYVGSYIQSQLLRMNREVERNINIGNEDIPGEDIMRSRATRNIVIETQTSTENIRLKDLS